jgi:hypothetical protein
MYNFPFTFGSMRLYKASNKPDEAEKWRAKRLKTEAAEECVVVRGLRE